MNVCVVGAGRAGIEAAREAARCGADVVLIDSLGAPLPDWESWPALVDGHPPPTAATALPAVKCIFGTKVLSFAQGSAARGDGKKQGADALVVAVGSTFEAPTFEGRGKAGVSVLDSPRKYEQLGRDIASAETAVVAGEGARTLEIAERIAGSRKVTALLTSWQHGPPGPLAWRLLRDAAERRGISLKKGEVEGALGAGRCEAILTDGEVIPSEVLAVAPRRIPVRIPGPTAPGRQGAIPVGLDLATAVPGVYSAGGCAELTEGTPPHFTLVDEPKTSGRIAGANAAGRKTAMAAARRSAKSLFGLLWVRVGTGLAAARAAGFEADAVEELPGGDSACTIVYDHLRGTVLGLEAVVERGRRELEIPPISPHVDLRQLAYDGGSGSSDISMVSETARLGLERWSRSSSAITLRSSSSASLKRLPSTTGPR